MPTEPHTIRLHDRVRVRLTDYGRMIYRRYYLDLEPLPAPEVPEGGAVMLWLWQVMAIFGPEVDRVGGAPFVDDAIERIG